MQTTLPRSLEPYNELCNPDKGWSAGGCMRKRGSRGIRRRFDGFGTSIHKPWKEEGQRPPK